ncbi:hybrid signal transduction histidine kinase M, partial [Tanacetum coccineum]
EFIQPPTSTRTTTTETPPDEWLTADSIVQSWIYITLSDSLLERVLKSKPTTAKDAWDALEKIFTDNKRSKNVELVGELRTLDIGDQTVDAYFRKINSIATRLSNRGSTITEEDIVLYNIHGLSDKYDQVM